MVLDQNTMFCGFSLTRKRKMSAGSVMESDPPYGSSATIDSSSEALCVDLQWWADVIESTELADTIRRQCDEKVLLIDCRSFIEFNQSNIVNSINVCCNKIVKRRLQQNKVKIQDFLSSTCHIEIDSGYTIVVYDQSTTDASTLESDNIVTILGTKCKQAFSRVRVLYGGFLEFQAQHPSLLETKTKTPSGQQASASLSQPCMPVTNTGPTKILPYLFLGSMKDALNAELAKANGITYVLNVSMTCPKPAHIQDGHFLRIPVNDNYSEKLLPYFHDAFQFIDKVREANGCVLVHCLAGISRSPTLAIAYIMRSYNMVSEDAYRYVKEKRVTISPNFNFLGQLLEYEQQITDNSLSTAGTKRRCIDDLRAELASPSSPVAQPRLPLKLNTDLTRLPKAQSPTSALARLKFEHCVQQGKGVHSPTTAFSKLKFGALTEVNSEMSRKIVEEPEYMTCYTADTIHQNTSSNNSPCNTPTRSVSLQLLNSNCNNNNSSQLADSSSPDRSPSPTFCGMRPSRPMSLSLTTVDKVTSPASIKRPLSLGINILQDPKVTSPTESKTNQMTVTVAEATPPSEQEKVTLAQANSDSDSSFKPNDIQSDCSSSNTENTQVVLREKKSPNKARPRSMALPENTTPKENIQLPSTPTTDRLSPAYNSEVTSSLGMILASAVHSDSEQQRKSRSLEDMYLIDHTVCRGCLSDSSCQCSASKSLTINQSNTSLSSQGSHSSLHGSLEIVQVS